MLPESAPGSSVLVEKADLDPARAQPMSWKDYQKQVNSSWNDLLSSDPNEPAVQYFLEQNPSFLPGVNEYGTGHHNPVGGVLYSQPPLRNLGPDRIPDFMWIGKTSEEVTPVFIEIEPPSKPWFTKKGNLTAHFNHAHKQLAEWKNWFTVAENQVFFRDLYLRWPSDMSQLPFNPHYILIYGRRNKDWTDDQVRTRSTIRRHNEQIMTFDRLEPRELLKDVVTVKLSSSGIMRAIGMAPCLTTGPDMGETFTRIERGSLEAVISRMDQISDERKAHILGRVAHWSSKREEQNYPFERGRGE